MLRHSSGKTAEKNIACWSVKANGIRGAGIALEKTQLENVKREDVNAMKPA